MFVLDWMIASVAMRVQGYYINNPKVDIKCKKNCGARHFARLEISGLCKEMGISLKFIILHRIFIFLQWKLLRFTIRQSNRWTLAVESKILQQHHQSDLVPQMKLDFPVKTLVL